MAGPNQQNNLEKVEHIVVLLLENRSFDQMLAFLALERGRNDIEAPTRDNSNILTVKDAEGYRVTNRDGIVLPAGTAFPSGEVLERDTLFGNGSLIPNGTRFFIHHFSHDKTALEADPPHSSSSVARQIDRGVDEIIPEMGGFVNEYARTRAEEGANPADVMGYYGAAELPVYDLIAQFFCVCDRWHSSLAGPTWPNRLFAIAGDNGGLVNNKKGLPFYDGAAFVRELDRFSVSWKWYFHDLCSLGCIDPTFRHFLMSDGGLPRSGRIEYISQFFDDAREGRLPAVSFIDPNWVDIGSIDTVGEIVHQTSPFESNDDHPPSDVRKAQELVLEILIEMLRNPQQWEKTFFLVVYDEHGGFYDHVKPPRVDEKYPPLKDEPSPDPETRFGVRVPALIISPWVASGSVSHNFFEHTSIIKTIYRKFCPAALESAPARVKRANDLLELLTEAQPRLSPFCSAAPRIERELIRAERLADRKKRGAPRLRKPTDMELEMLAAQEYVRRVGLPTGAP